MRARIGLIGNRGAVIDLKIVLKVKASVHVESALNTNAYLSLAFNLPGFPGPRSLLDMILFNVCKKSRGIRVILPAVCATVFKAVSDYFGAHWKKGSMFHFVYLPAFDSCSLNDHMLLENLDKRSCEATATKVALGLTIPVLLGIPVRNQLPNSLGVGHW